MQYRFSELRRLAWVTLVSDISGCSQKNGYPLSGAHSFCIFQIPFLQDTLDTKWKLSYTCGDVWQVSMEWKKEGILFPVLLQLKKAGNLFSVFLQSRHLGPLFQVLCSFLAFWISWQDHILWFWSLRSERNLSVHLAHRKYLKFLSRTVTIFL